MENKTEATEIVRCLSWGLESFLPSWEQTYPLMFVTFEDGFPFSKIGYVSSLRVVLSVVFLHTVSQSAVYSSYRPCMYRCVNIKIIIYIEYINMYIHIIHIPLWGLFETYCKNQNQKHPLSCCHYVSVVFVVVVVVVVVVVLCCVVLCCVVLCCVVLLSLSLSLSLSFFFPVVVVAGAVTVAVVVVALVIGFALVVDRTRMPELDQEGMEISSFQTT